MAEKLKFYYSPGSCALASHIALEEAGADFEPLRVALAKGEQNTPEYRRINPKGRVPALADGDFIVTENPAIMRFVARRYPGAKLWPDDPREEARCAEWLAWISSTIHVAYAHIRRAERYASDPTAIENVKQKGRETCREYWAAVDERIARHPWAAGRTYSVADGYAQVFWNWGQGPVLGFDMAKDYPNWTAHARRMAERPAVQRAFAREELPLPV
ncbi:MAG TPA: glutathione binding-like protein [Xanthobacteraceae bacterium]|jgi:glutathione S-transferase